MQKPLQEWIDWHKGQISSFHTKDLAVYLGISVRTIQRWIKGQTEPKEEQLQKIERYLLEKNSKN